jgi:hypothetical protein
MNRKRNPSKDRFRAGRRIAEKAAQKARSPQLVFTWFADHAPPAAKDPAPGTSGRATA